MGFGTANQFVKIRQILTRYRGLNLSDRIVYLVQHLWVFGSRSDFRMEYLVVFMKREHVPSFGRPQRCLCCCHYCFFPSLVGALC